VDPEVIPNVEIKKKPFINNNSPEQTFGAVLSDKIYLLSTDNKLVTPGTPISFETLNSYELEQEEYILKVEPNTYSTIRGEKLTLFLKSFYTAFVSHIHNPCKPFEQSDPNFTVLKKLFETLDNDLLNKSIRIN
jgi:hypothetical protein